MHARENAKSCDPTSFENDKLVAYMVKDTKIDLDVVIVDFWGMEPYNATSRVCRYPDDEEDDPNKKPIPRNCANYKAVCWEIFLFISFQ